MTMDFSGVFSCNTHFYCTCDCIISHMYVFLMWEGIIVVKCAMNCEYFWICFVLWPTRQVPSNKTVLAVVAFVCLLLFMCCLLSGFWCLLHYSALLDASLCLLLRGSCLTEKCQFRPVNKSPQQEKGLFLYTLSLYLLQTHLPYSKSFLTLVCVISLSDPRIIVRLFRIY